MSLSPAHREVLELIYDEDLKLGEIACKLDVPLGTVKTRAFYALRRCAPRCGSGASMAERHPDLVEWALGELDADEALRARGAPARLRRPAAARRDELRGLHRVLERAAAPFEVPAGPRAARRWPP